MVIVLRVSEPCTYLRVALGIVLENQCDVGITLRVTNIMLPPTAQPGPMKIAQQVRWTNTSVPKKETHPKKDSWRTRQEDVKQGNIRIDLFIT
jgi:hypothetical protein